MTAANLAVIFGPNLLQRERGSDAGTHIYAMGIEDSTAIINVTLVLIQNYRRLFTVYSHVQLSYCATAHTSTVSEENKNKLQFHSTSAMCDPPGFCGAAAGGPDESDPDRPGHHRLSAAKETQVITSLS